MKTLLPMLFILLSNLSYGQVKAVVINGTTKEKVPYANVWVDNEDIGTTSGENGAFELNFEGSKTLESWHSRISFCKSSYAGR